MSCRRTMCQLLLRRLGSSAAGVRPLATDLRLQRSAVFSREQARQRALYPRTEKIEVILQNVGLQGTLLVMNKGVSTPHSCTRHLTEWHVSSSVLALVDGEAWPLHQPLTQSCSLSLLTFKDSDPQLVNQTSLMSDNMFTDQPQCRYHFSALRQSSFTLAYWRSCAGLLGQVLEDAFKEDFTVELLPIPEVPVTSGAFCCDVVLDPQLDSWKPSEETLRSLTRGVQQLILQDLPWEPLEVAPSVALEVFSYSSCKQKEVEEKAAQSSRGTVMLYRCGDHVLLTGGPLVARTGLCSQYEVTAIHTLGNCPWGLQRRVQGLSLPLQLQAHHTVWKKLRSRAEKLLKVPSESTNKAAADMLSPPPSAVTPPSSAVTPPPATETQTPAASN